MWGDLYLGNLAKSSAFLSKVDHNATAAILGFLDSLLDAEYQIRPASADVGPENITAVALSCC